MALYTISCFSGVGGLDLGLHIATGSRVVCHVEREAYAASILAQRMQDGAIDPGPIWSDITTFDASAWRGCVDIVTGGFPCQDISVAGSGAGIEGERSGLWSELCRVYRDSGARWLFAENVAAVTVRGLERIVCDLAALGCAAEWTCLRASDVGAPHRRDRFFLLAQRVPDAERNTLWAKQGRLGSVRAGASESRDMGAYVADCNSDGRQGQRSDGVFDRQRPTQRDDADRCVTDVADTETRRLRCRRAPRQIGQSACAKQAVDDSAIARLSQRPGIGRDGGEEHAAIERASGNLGNANGCDLYRDDMQRFAWPPGPASGHEWVQVPAHLKPAIEPGLRCVADGTSVVVDAARSHQLRALGNGVVPLQAAVAFAELRTRLAEF